jgi:hypothetical protein
VAIHSGNESWVNVSQAFPKASDSIGVSFPHFIENYFEKIIIFFHKFHEICFAGKP